MVGKKNLYHIESWIDVANMIFIDVLVKIIDEVWIGEERKIAVAILVDEFGVIMNTATSKNIYKFGIFESVIDFESDFATSGKNEDILGFH